LAQFRSTADILDLALIKAGEVTNGNSAYEIQALDYLNRVHLALVAGGTIPLGKDQTIQIDEVWPWSRAKSPTIIELQPKYTTGSITLTQGSEAGVFSAAPAASLKGYHFKVDGRSEWFKIGAHTAASTDFELDSAYPDDSGSGLTYIAVKLDYDIVPEFITVNTGNNKFQVQKASGTTLTATLTAGVYAVADLITHVASVATAAAGGPTITGAYSTTTRKFSLTSDLAGATSFYIVGNGDQSGFSIHKALGFDDVTSSASSATQSSTYVLGGVCRLVEPFKIHKGAFGSSVFGIDAEAFQRDYPFSTVGEGYPDRFTVIKEGSDGTFTVRFNRYPVDKTRIEVEHVPVPRDLQDSSSSIPLVPRKHVDVLEDATVFYLMLLKSDDRASAYAGLLQGKLGAMISQNRGALVRSGKDFGQITSRRDKMGRRGNIFGTEPY
jgi:hypothetical protein